MNVSTPCIASRGHSIIFIFFNECSDSLNAIHGNQGSKGNICNNRPLMQFVPRTASKMPESSYIGSPKPLNMPLPEFTGTLGVKRAAHLLRRATFGATRQDIDTYAALTPAQAIVQLFHQNLPDPALPVDPVTNTEWVLTGTTDANSGDEDLQEYFKRWFIGQMLSTGITPSLALPWSAREKMVFFLHTHFTAIQSKINSSRALYFQNQLFRLFALDALNPDPEVNFKTLTKKISVDNA